MSLKSKSKLFTFLSRLFKQDFSLKHPAIGDETYGPKSFIYIYCDKLEMKRRELENKLEEAGFKTCRSYSPGQPVIEVAVSYFKGWHWDE